MLECMQLLWLSGLLAFAGLPANKGGPQASYRSIRAWFDCMQSSAHHRHFPSAF